MNIAKGALLGGSRGVRAPLLFCPPRGIHTEEQKNCTCFFFIFPEIPRLVHPCYLGRMGAPAYMIGISNVMATFFYIFVVTYSL